MTRISMLRNGTWYTLEVQSAYTTQPTAKDVALERVKSKHTAFAHDQDVPVIVQEMENLGLEVKGRTHVKM